MNRFTVSVVGALLAVSSFASVAAVQVFDAPQNQQQIGIIGATTLSDLGLLEEKLAEKADKLGGSSFRTASAVGHHLLHGTAVVYQ